MDKYVVTGTVWEIVFGYKDGPEGRWVLAPSAIRVSSPAGGLVVPWDCDRVPTVGAPVTITVAF